MNHKKYTIHKHIETSQIKKLKLFNKFIWLIPVLIFLYFMGGSFKNIIKDFQYSFSSGIFTLAFDLIGCGILSIPLMMLWRSMFHTLYKNAVKSATFNVLQDFDYYRDELTGISPAAISMCMDLEIEVEKDISAQFLKFSLNNIVEINGDHITVLNKEAPGLTKSDLFLLQAVENGTLNRETAMEWKQLAISEVVNGDFIRRKEREVAKGSQGCLSTVFLWVVMLCITMPFIFKSTLNGTLTQYEQIWDSFNTERELFEYLRQNPELQKYFLGMMAILILFVFTICRPFILLIKGFLMEQTKALFQRTEEGEIVTEEIYGLKNFIHDFSDLSHADKETLILWDDFLIYAVLLEENTEIVKEILNLRNVNLFNLTLS